MIQHFTLRMVLAFSVCFAATRSDAQEKRDDKAEEKALLEALKARQAKQKALLDFLKAKGVELRPVEVERIGSYIQSRFTIGPDHDKKHIIGLNYLPPLTPEKAREEYLGFSLPHEFYGDWAVFMVGGPGGNASPAYKADWKRLTAALKEYESRAKEVSEPVNDQQFHPRLLKIAEIYTAYGRVDDEYRWAPWLCRMPMPGQARSSRSSDEATHGQKLYSLFARDRDAYLQMDKASAVGQIVVKESWVPEVLKEKPKVADLVPAAKGKPIQVPDDLAQARFAAALRDFGDHFYPYAEKEGKWYKASQRGPLFVMMKLDAKTPGTDDGWVYATVTADGKMVTSAGRVASCMKCHETKKDRLFGLRPGA
jgi:hypothetical protein